MEILNNPQLNKGTAFTKEERIALGLLGRLPERVETLDEQVARVYAQYQSIVTPKHKNTFLTNLHNTNQVLFYKLAATHLEEMAPIIYTPTVAVACQTFSEEFRRPSGLYISYPDKDQIEIILENRTNKDIDLIVVTDGERILGIGDQGVGGMGIPVGKLMLYSLMGGLDPKRTLPIVLDVGTNNQDRLNNPMYLGWKHPRIAGAEYDDFIAKFVSALKKKLPHVFLQWEDFGKNNAPRILEKYRDELCSFNDDIQGTAVVTLAAILAALKMSNQKITEQRIVFLGAGSAATGIADLIRSGMRRAGMSDEAARKCFWLVGISGLRTDKSENVIASQRPYLRNDSDKISFADVVKNVKPTILIGCSTAKGAFTEEVVKEMAKHVERPIIFPLSNPTDNCEATPEDLIKWTNGKVLVATGSPFPEVAQCNNVLVFPGIGLGAVAVKATKISEAMLWAACEVTHSEAPNLQLLPSIKDAPLVARKIAYAVAEAARKEGLTSVSKDVDLKKLIDDYRWEPEY